MIEVICVILGLIATAGGAALYYCLKRLSYLVDVIEKLNDAVEQSIEDLEKSHQELVKIERMDVASNDPVVQRVVRAVVFARRAVHKVASQLASFDSEENVEDHKED